MVELIVKPIQLHIGHEIASVGHAGRGRLGRSRLDEPGSSVDAHRLPTRSHEGRDLQRGIAKPAADIQDVLSRLRREHIEGGIAVHSQPVAQNLAKLNEPVEQRTVPGIDRLDVLGCFLLSPGNAHANPQMLLLSTILGHGHWWA